MKLNPLTPKTLYLGSLQDLRKAPEHPWSARKRQSRAKTFTLGDLFLGFAVGFSYYFC